MNTYANAKKRFNYKKKEGKANEDHVEEAKGLAVAMQNFTWFFFQVLFVGGAGGILVQTTLAGLGYEVELIDLAAAEIPVALVALVFPAHCYFER